MTDPLSAARVAEQARPRWGVWDRHSREWVAAPEHDDEREAWFVLLQVDSLHPWELEVRERDPLPDEGGALVDCPKCSGDGSCYACDQDCPTCDGEGRLTADEAATVRR